jgi:hypothetical protein
MVIWANEVHLTQFTKELSRRRLSWFEFQTTPRNGNLTRPELLKGSLLLAA